MVICQAYQKKLDYLDNLDKWNPPEDPNTGEVQLYGGAYPDIVNSLILILMIVLIFYLSSLIYKKIFSSRQYRLNHKWVI